MARYPATTKPSRKKNNYLTALTKLQRDGVDRLVSIIDVEKVLAEIIDYDIQISEEVLDNNIVNHFHGRKVLIVDDSATARSQIRDTLSQLGLQLLEASDGLMALNLLKVGAMKARISTMKS